MLKFIFVPLLFTGCVSLSYHQKTLAEAHRFELDRAKKLAREVYHREITIGEMMDMLRDYDK